MVVFARKNGIDLIVSFMFRRDAGCAYRIHIQFVQLAMRTLPETIYCHHTLLCQYGGPLCLHRIVNHRPVRNLHKSLC